MKIKLFENFDKVEETANDKVMASVYHWGEYREDIEMTEKELEDMYQLGEDELAGFNLRKEDENKTFYAEERDIDDSGDGSDGIGVKNAYGVNDRNVI